MANIELFFKNIYETLNYSLKCIFISFGMRFYELLISNNFQLNYFY